MYVMGKFIYDIVVDVDHKMLESLNMAVETKICHGLEINMVNNVLILNTDYQVKLLCSCSKQAIA